MKTDLTKSINPFTTKTKLIRLIWSIIWPLFKYLPKFASTLRVAVLRLFGAKIGLACLIESGVKILIPWNLYLSNFVVIGKNVEIYNFGKVSISTMTVISQYCYLCSGSHDYTHPHMPLIWKDIAIGSECWITAGVFIAPGVTISDGIVVGSQSVVTKNLTENWSVYAGNPCAYIKHRQMKELNE